MVRAAITCLKNFLGSLGMRFEIEPVDPSNGSRCGFRSPRAGSHCPPARLWNGKYHEPSRVARGTGKTSGRAQNRLKAAHQFAAAGTPIPQAPAN